MAEDPIEKPEEFIFSNIPRTKKEKIARTAEARVTETIKSALQSYLGRYFDPRGVHREQLTLTAGFTVNYETRISGPRDNEDPTIYQVQLERYWTELRQKLPAILIVDTGFSRETTGLGGITDSRQINDSLSQVELSMLATVPIELQIASMDATTCSDLRDALEYIFGVLTHLNKGHVIRSDRPEDKWEVRIPLTETSSGLERRNVTDDPKDSFWTATLSLEMVFEGISAVIFDRQVQANRLADGKPISVGVGAGTADRLSLNYQISDQYMGVDPMGFRTSDGKCVPLATSSPTLDAIRVPESVKINQNTPIELDWMPAWGYFVSDNPRIALIDVTTCSIVPRRPGIFKVHLMDSRTPNGPSPIRTWEVQVTLS
tara:strand:+ start:159 stop:1280 length:1122 start_codon:yes stop_codon:yes gene_type:complete